MLPLLFKELNKQMSLYDTFWKNFHPLHWEGGEYTKEDGFSYKFFISLPGIPKDNLKLSVEEDTLILEETQDNPLYSNRFKKQFLITDMDVVVTKISAKSKDGLLEITLPKITKPSKKPIEIKIE